MLASICIGCLHMYELFYSPLSGAVSAAQLNDTVESYAVAKAVRDNTVQNLIIIGFIVFTFLTLWLKPFRTLLNSKKTALFIPMALGLFGMISCAPVKVIDYKDIKSNETAWAIPLDAESKNNQVRFDSVAFLNQKKISVKRIMIDKVSRKIGRMPWSIEWIPTIQIITVDRSLVTREWTSNSQSKQGIVVVTQDSVGLEVGLTITASIDEEDASTYLYYHGARPLSQLLDENVRSFAVSELTREYSNRDLTTAQKEGDIIYKNLFDNAVKIFKAKGLTVQFLGNQGGLEYKEARVQNSINARYIAEQDTLTALQEEIAQSTRNKSAIGMAQAEADKAKKLAEAKEAVNFQTDNQVRLLTAQANMKMAERWTGQMPANILPANSPLLMNMGEKR
jgi:hypothetical protein